MSDRVIECAGLQRTRLWVQILAGNRKKVSGGQWRHLYIHCAFTTCYNFYIHSSITTILAQMLPRK